MIGCSFLTLSIFLGPVECRTEYESECETKYHKHYVEDDVPDCVTLKEYKCETVVKGYSEEEVGRKNQRNALLHF